MLVFEPEAVAVDADHDRVVQDAIEHRRSEHAVASESGIPTAEGEIRSEDHRAAFIALRHDLEEQAGLLAAREVLRYGVPHVGVGQFSIGDPGSVLHQRLH
jgi:hypothetical protein